MSHRRTAKVIPLVPRWSDSGEMRRNPEGIRNLGRRLRRILALAIAAWVLFGLPFWWWLP